MIIDSNDSVTTMHHTPDEHDGFTEDILLESTRAIIELPVNTIEATINAVVYIDGKLENVTSTLAMAEIRKAFQRGENCIEDDDVWQLTDKGREYVEKCAI